jgi:hypothetical protein
MGDGPRRRRSAAVGLVIAIAGAGVIGYLIARPHTVHGPTSRQRRVDGMGPGAE